MKAKLVCFFLAILPFQLLLSKPAFENSNFEKGNFDGWILHEGWSLTSPVYFPTEKIQGEERFGYYSAVSSPRGRDIIEFYTGKNIAPEKRLLKSIPFLIDKPFLSFTMDGQLDGVKNTVGVDIDGDGVCDVNLNQNTIRGLEPGRKRFFLDLSGFIGKQASFIVSVSSPPKYFKMFVDDLELTDSVPCHVELREIQQTGDRAEAEILVSNKSARKGKAQFAFVIYDFLGGKIREGEENLEIASGDSAVHKIDFNLNGSPYYRIHVTSLTEAGAVDQYVSKRWFISEIKTGRQAILINEGWDVTKSDDTTLKLPAADAAWEKDSPVKPSGSYGYRSPLWREKKAQTWYRKELEIPDWFDEQNCTVFLNGGGGGLLTIFLNGKEVATKNILKYNNYRFILKDIRKDRNELVLRFRNPDFYLKDGKDYTEPVWYYYGPSIGVFGNIYLENLPDFYISKVLIDPSVKDKKLNLRVFINNLSEKEGRFEIHGQVNGKDCRELLDFHKGRIVVGQKAEETVEISKEWRNPVLWTPDRPELLTLRLELKAGDQRDVYEERFGFREFRTEKNRILLNGFPFRILDLTMLETEKLYLAKKWQGANAKRAPWISYNDPAVHDETGFLFRGLFEHIYPPKEYNSPEAKERYWQKYIQYEIGTMEYLYNNPACWSWAVGNEIGGSGYFRHSDFKERYMDLAKTLSSIDPTRSVSADGDLDLFGASQIWNAHYPHEYGMAYGLPNNAYFFKKGVELMDWFPHPPYDGEKPVFLGEAFSGGNISPDWLSPLGGERVFTPAGLFDTWEKLFMMRQRAYRDQDIVGYEPFEAFLYVLNFYPVDVYVKNYDHHFYGGRKLNREVVVFNDTFSRNNLILNWKFGRYSKGEVPLNLSPGEKKVIPIQIDLPSVTRREDIEFSIGLLGEDKRPVAKRWGQWKCIYSIFPQVKIGTRAAVYPQDEQIEKMLQFFNVHPASKVEKADVVFTSGSLLEDAALTGNILARGGLIMVTGQKKEIEGFPGLTLHSDTHSHIVAHFHPVLKDIDRQEDFSLWGENNWVGERFYLKPDSGYAKIIVEGGDRQGLRLSNLLEMPRENGSIILCSLPLGDNYRSNPVAGYLLRNICEYAKTLRDRTVKKTGTILSDNAYLTLRNRGFLLDDLASMEKPKIEGYDILWIDAGIAGADADMVADFAKKKGKILVLNRLTPDNLKLYKDLLPPDFRLLPAKQDIVHGGELVKTKKHPLLDGISNNEFFWKKGTFERGGPKIRITCQTADFSFDSDEMEILTSPAALGIYQTGGATVIVDQLKWDESLNVEGKAARALATLAYNLKVSLSDGKKSRGVEHKNLVLPYNARMEKEKIDGLDRDISLTEKTQDGRILTLDNKCLVLGTDKNFISYPRSVKIPVNSRAENLCFMHTSAFGYIDYDKGKEVIEYILTMKENGQKRQVHIPVRYANEIFEFISEDPGTFIDTEQLTRYKEEGISVYLYKWRNPSPDSLIEAIEIVSRDEKIVPLIFGISLQTPQKTVIERRREGLWSAASRQDVEEKGRIWAIVGPFPNNPPPRGGYDAVYPPEKEIDFQKSYAGYGKTVKWEKFVQTEDSYGKVILIDRLELFEIKEPMDRQNYVCYFYTRIYSEKTREVIVASGFDDAGKIWLNGQPVHELFVHKNPSIPAEYMATAVLKKGWNQMLIKVVNNFLETSFYFDIKEKNAMAIEKWHKGDRLAISGLPSLKLQFDAYAREKEIADIPDFLRLEIKGKKYTCNAVGKPFESFTYYPVEKQVKVDFRGEEAEQLYGIVPYEIEGKMLEKGRFGMEFLVPKGASSSHIVLASRNAGGKNIGDVFIEIYGGVPSEQYGGKKGTSSVPYQTILLRYDREESKEVRIPLQGIFRESEWQRLLLVWGGDEGIQLFLNGKILHQDKYDKLPLFGTHRNVNLFLASDTRKRNEGEILVKNVFLTGE